MNFESIQEGSQIEYSYQIDRNVYESFLNAFQDTSPIHISDEYAVKQGFPEKVMHGNILNGFISHFVGVVFPGEKSLIQYKNPSFLNDSIKIIATISQVVESVRVIIMELELINLTQNKTAATAKVQVGVRE